MLGAWSAQAIQAGAEVARAPLAAEAVRRIDLIFDAERTINGLPAERALRGIALGRKAWLFAGSHRGGDRAAAMYSLIVTAKLNDVDPRAWLADVLARIADHPASKLDELLPWNWQNSRAQQVAAA